MFTLDNAKMRSEASQMFINNMCMALAGGDAYHWPGESGLAKSALDTRMDRNCRVVMTAAKSKAPNFLIVCKMKSCPAQASARQSVNASKFL